ncbi:MAG: FAD-binding oxidoreductase [Hyphomicrobiaceae bacterium]
MANSRFISRLKRAVGAQGVQEASDLAGRDSGIDGANLDAGLAVAPKSTQEIAQVLALCHEHGVAAVPQGGLTGLAGAAATVPGQLIISTGRLNREIDIDPTGGTALVDAGVTLEALNDAARPFGLSAGIDIGSRGTATIGGMLATNAGGGEAFRNGVMRHRLLGLEAVTATGTVMSDLKRVAKANEGLDVKQLFVGSEGTLGIITRAVLKLEAFRADDATALVGCETAAQASAVLSALRASPSCELCRAEIMWHNFATVSAADLGLSSLLSFADCPVYVIFEVTLLPSANDDFAGILTDAMEEAGVEDAIIAQSERERADMWRIREDSWTIQRQHPHGFWFDVSVPQARIDDYLGEVNARMKQVDPALLVFVMGHLGDGNLHFTITKGVPLDADYPAVSDAVYDGLSEMGGSFSAEHGIGTEKKSALAARCDPGKMEMMAAIKHALDPKGIMNPGKVFDQII